MVDTTAPLARMWRSVYQKASEAAAARMGDLLRDHVYLFHRNPPTAGGGGGGLVELGRAVATAGQQDLRVPASGALPTGYSRLELVATGRNNHATALQNSDVYVFFNDDVAPAGGGSVNPGGYQYSAITHTVGGTTVQVGGSAGTDSWNVGLCPAFNAADPQSSWGLSGTVPLPAGAGLPKTGQFVAGGRRAGAGEPPVVRTTAGVYTTAGSPYGPITSVTLRCGLLWRAGATLIVYGVPDAV